MAGAGDSLTTTLEALKAQDLIRQVRVLPEPKYIFKHVLTQVVVYETLLFVRRQALHELIAQATEELYAGRIEEHYESLAYHYQHSDNREKAIHYLHLAGNKAKARYVLQQTVKNYQHAITLLESLDKGADRMRMHIDIAVKWADLVVPSSELIEALKRAQLYAEQLDDNDRLAKATSFLGQMLFYVGNTDAAIPELTRVIEMSGLLTDQDRVGSAYRVLGHLYTNHGNRAEGLRNLKLALPIVRATGNCFEEACSIGLIARERGFSGEFTQSFQTFNEAVRVAQAGRERSVEAWIVGMWKGFVYCTKGDWHAAAATCDEAMAICRDIENLWAAALAMVTKGYAISMMETSKTHIALLEQGVAQHKQTGVPVLSMDVLSTFAEILCLNAQYDEALEQADGALERSRDGFYAPAKPRAHRVRAMAMARRGGYDWSVIEAAMDSSLASATEADIPSERGVGHFRYAEILHEKGDRARAREHLSKAEELFCELEMSWWMDKAANLRRMIQ